MIEFLVQHVKQIFVLYGVLLCVHIVLMILHWINVFVGLVDPMVSAYVFIGAAVIALGTYVVYLVAFSLWYDHQEGEEYRDRSFRAKVRSFFNDSVLQ